MKLKWLIPLAAGLSVLQSSCVQHITGKSDRYRFNQILNIHYTPNDSTRCYGCYTDAGSWMGFTIPDEIDPVNGFCGPFSIDKRYFMAKSVVTPFLKNAGSASFVIDSTDYFPGELLMKSQVGDHKLEQRLWFIDANTALLNIRTDSHEALSFTGESWSPLVELSRDQNQLIAKHPSGELLLLNFEPDVVLNLDSGNYIASKVAFSPETNITISFLSGEQELLRTSQQAKNILKNPNNYVREHDSRWNGYLSKTLREDMDSIYDRIAVKSVVTLISNWRTHRGGLLHEGVIPSHGVGYFVGFWAWDSWRFSAALSRFAPELAKNNIRAMFDYQQPDGMIIDCIYTDTTENNARDSKPPLVSWAVNEIFEQTGDTAFIREMYPQLRAYYNWWYQKRDHDGNKICEFGSTDGTVEAAAWESGMDNAIRFDEAAMLQNGHDAYSFDQESVDLNAYLAYEHQLLSKFGKLIGQPFDQPYYGNLVADYFFDDSVGFFFDRRISDRSFVREEGCEAYIPLWTGIATQQQADRMLVRLKDTTKFNTYIPFPTVAADNPRFMPKGYWRGPIWLDQTYFAIKGLRNYGYGADADEYTMLVFDRLDGLTDDAPIHENYGTHTGERLKAPHFSWSAAHLLMMYEEYGK